MKKKKLSEFAKHFDDKLSSKHKLYGCFNRFMRRVLNQIRL